MPLVWRAAAKRVSLRRDDGDLSPTPDLRRRHLGRYLYFRANPKGAHAERWRHTFGCEQWFNVRRDTVSHAVEAVYGISDPAPGGDLP